MNAERETDGVLKGQWDFYVSPRPNIVGSRCLTNFKMKFLSPGTLLGGGGQTKLFKTFK